MESAVFRFLIDARDNETEKYNIISNALVCALIASIVFIIIYIPIFICFSFEFNILFPFCLLVTIFSSIILQICRGLGDNLGYSLASVVTGVGTIILNILFLLLFRFGSEALLMSSLLANICCIVLVLVRLKLPLLSIFKNFDLRKLKKMLKYSIPLIPNGIIWWIIGVSDKTIITLFNGASMNGIYAISQKFSNLIMNIYGVFNMSWSESISMHINEDDSSAYISEIFDNILFFFSIICSLILLSLVFLLNLFVSKDYSMAYNYIPLLLVGAIFNMIASFFGGIYVALKRTNEIAKTSFYAGLINIAVNLILIKYIGLYAACISTILSFLIISLYRYFDCKKYVNVQLKLKRLLSIFLVMTISLIIYYLNDKLLATTMIIFICSILYKKYIKHFYFLLKKLRGRV